MIIKVRDTHCWVVMVGSADHGNEIHFETEAKFTAWAKMHGYTGKPARQLRVPCWLAKCSTAGCEGCEGDEDGDPAHIAAHKEQHVLAELDELVLVRGHLMCQECVEKAIPPAPPAGARPAIVTYDEIGRALALLVQLRAQFAHQIDLEPADQAVLAKAEALVGKHPQGHGRELVYVHPFAVQPPLPDMPPISIATAGSLR